ncbi:F-box protein At5g07610-like [Bidens hawaiensis]|uniref:F-box protein At5g07610-like n=1 Tax=Bidens hawaiensis TaxID=980011 RepID=UPI004049CC9D
MEDFDHHQSVAVIGSNDDLLTEILVRLPATSILRFKSVSKHWRSLLTHKHFIHRYDDSKLLKSPGFFARIHFTGHCHAVPKSIYVAFDGEDRSTAPFRGLDSVVIEHSCNGLLLCAAFHNGAYEYYVFNPITKQLAFIPLPSVPEWRSVDDTILSVALAFHQTDCVHYKVVCVCALERSRRLIQIQVYSSDTGKWKICVESFSSQKIKFRHHQVVYWNGAVHWAPDYRSNKILYYKLDVEQLQISPMPEGLVSHKVYTLYLGESRGHLHLSRAGPEEDILSLNVYEMLRDHSGWVVNYRVNALLGDVPEMIWQYQALENFRNMNSGNRYVFRVVDVVRGISDEDTFLVLLTPSKLLRYNVHDKSFKELYSNKDYNEFAYEFASVHRYIQTLSSF